MARSNIIGMLSGRRLPFDLGCGFRQTRYIGQAKTHLQHVAIAATLNLARLAD